MQKNKEKKAENLEIYYSTKRNTAKFSQGFYRTDLNYTKELFNQEVEQAGIKYQRDSSPES